MKTINPEVARQISINFFIAHLPILMLSGFVVASLVGLIFRSSALFWIALLITPFSINYLYSKKRIKQFCKDNKCTDISCLAKQTD
ncbi:hypothetical protein NQS96_02730 [Pseudoalteromonas shioyasakiensis]|uniref:hypothetical protein n=1 Tax=Pseudoalteromonas TaxID=53246 RepID=UPI002117A4E9|nr:MULTISPECIES: hypothetical protein [Pseudoalteromonas]MCQ8880719.1 hypothetical protein [Pseudoalteromonas shioyasakiensis]